jgi:hypothetical protein
LKLLFLLEAEIGHEMAERVGIDRSWSWSPPLRIWPSKFSGLEKSVVGAVTALHARQIFRRQVSPHRVLRNRQPRGQQGDQAQG